MFGKHLLHSDKGEVREMLMVDGIELAFIHEPLQVRKTPSLSHPWISAQSSCLSRNRSGQAHAPIHYWPSKRSPACPRHQLARGLFAEELDDARNALRHCRFRAICRWLDASTGTPAPLKYWSRYPSLLAISITSAFAPNANRSRIFSV